MFDFAPPSIEPAVEVRRLDGSPTQSPFLRPIASTTIRAGDLRDLTAALAKAQPGSVIVLAPGAYPQLSIQGLNLKGPVTVMARGARTDGLVIARSSGLRIVGLEVQLEEGGGGRLTVNESRNITLSDVAFSGPASRQGLVISGSQDVRVERSRFTGLKNGVVHSETSGLTVEGSVFRRLSSDGVTGSGSSRLLIKDNDFADFAPSPGAHPDAVQLFARNPNIQVQDITIVGNNIDRGSGGIVQGVFIASNTNAYRGVVIRGNRLHGTMYNGIMVAGAEDVEISGNLVQPKDDMSSMIKVIDVKGARVFDNKYWKLLVQGGANVKVSDRPSLKFQGRR